MPEVRTGSKWQRRPSIGAWFDYAKKMIVAPTRSFSLLRIDNRDSRKLLLINLSIAAVMMAHPMIGVLTIDPYRGRLGDTSAGGIAAQLASIAMLWVAAMTLLSALTLIEYLGILFFARRRNWRLLPDAALQICAHSSLAWIAAAALLIVGLSFSAFLPQAGANRVATNFWDETVDGLRKVLPGLPPFAGFFLGMLWFEWLVYIGVRACKFANPPQTAATLAPDRTSV